LPSEEELSEAVRLAKEGAPAADMGRAVEAAEAAVYKRHERGFLIKPLVNPIDMRAALEAALPFLPAQAAEPVAVTVKPLDWDERNEAFYADTILGECEVAEQGDGYWYVIVDGRKHSDFLTRHDAQGYMQEQHRRLVTDWITPPALSGAAPQAGEDVPKHIAFRRAALARAAELDGSAFAGDLDPLDDDDTVEGLARSVAIVLAGYDWTVDPTSGRIVACVAADQGFAATTLVVDDATRRAVSALPVEGWRPTQAATDVLAERRRQVEVEGWTAKHDDRFRQGELPRAATAYSLWETKSPLPYMIKPFWPWDEDWFKPTNHRRNLVKAGALILAEIERLDRLPTPPDSQGGEDA